MEQVLKVNVYLADLADYKGMNEVFRGRFGPNPRFELRWPPTVGCPEIHSLKWTA